MLLNVMNSMLMYLVVDVESHSIVEEVASMMIKRLCLTMMFNRRTVLAVDVQDDLAVKDVVESQQWRFDVADVEPGREADVVANEQDVFVAVDVYGLVGCCRKSKLSVVWLKKYVVCEVLKRNRCNSTGVTKHSPATKKSLR